MERRSRPKIVQTYQGTPCKRGHSGIRYTNGGGCVECTHIKGRNQWRKSPEFRARKKELYYRPEAQARVREAQLKRKYGLTALQYEALALLQDYMCAICGKTETPLRIDHNHRTGVVRALLCTGCNLALGALRDQPTIAERAADYLRAHA